MSAYCASSCNGALACVFTTTHYRTPVKPDPYRRSNGRSNSAEHDHGTHEHVFPGSADPSHPHGVFLTGQQIIARVCFLRLLLRAFHGNHARQERRTHVGVHRERTPFASVPCNAWLRDVRPTADARYDRLPRSTLIGTHLPVSATDNTSTGQREEHIEASALPDGMFKHSFRG